MVGGAWSGRRRTVAAGVVLFVVAAACQTGRWTGPASAPMVSVIGDSLVFHAEGNFDGATPYHQYLADDLVAAGYQAHVSGYVGERVEQGYEQLWPLVADEPDLDTLVIALGTNDVHEGVPLEESRAALRIWLEDAADVRCIALIGLNVHATRWSFDTLAPPYNQMLLDEAGLHANTIYVPWEPDLAIHGTDGNVHMPTAEGQAQYRAAIVGAVDRCAARLAPTTTTTVDEATTTTTVDEAPTTATTVVEAPTTATTVVEASTTTTSEPAGT